MSEALPHGPSGYRFFLISRRKVYLGFLSCRHTLRVRICRPKLSLQVGNRPWPSAQAKALAHGGKLFFLRALCASARTFFIAAPVEQTPGPRESTPVAGPPSHPSRWPSGNPPSRPSCHSSCDLRFPT